MRQTFEIIANDFGEVRLTADHREIHLTGLDPGESVDVTVLAGTANPIGSNQ